MKPLRITGVPPLVSRLSTKLAVFSRGGIFVTCLAGLMVLAVVACGGTEATSPLHGTRGSKEALVQSVLDAVAAKDHVALQSFLVTREEYERFLWPAMPDKEYTPFNFVWSLNETNSRKGLRQLLQRYGGLSLELVSVELGEDPERYGSFTLYPGTKVKVRRRDTGQEGILPSIDVLVRYGRAWKLMNYDEL